MLNKYSTYIEHYISLKLSVNLSELFTLRPYYFLRMFSPFFENNSF